MSLAPALIPWAHSTLSAGFRPAASDLGFVLGTQSIQQLLILRGPLRLKGIIKENKKKITAFFSCLEV